MNSKTGQRCATRFVKTSLYVLGGLLIAGTAGNADVNPNAPMIEFIETAVAGFACIGAAMAMSREKSKKVTAVIEVLQPIGGTYCANPYSREK